MLQKGAGCILFTGATSSVRGGAIIPESAESAEPAESPISEFRFNCDLRRTGVAARSRDGPYRRHGIDLPLEKTFN